MESRTITIEKTKEHMGEATSLWDSSQHMTMFSYLEGIVGEQSVNELSLLGSFSEEMAKLAARKYARIVQKLGFPVSCLSCDDDKKTVVIMLLMVTIMMMIMQG